MFYKFDDVEECRLNRGVRGRLIEHCKFLVREKKIKGYDANEIYENTRELPYEDPTANYYDPTIDMRSSDEDSDEEREKPDQPE
mmetsp:Transcript_37884/g.49770  ORF Transcript_37884/g.49770 Transcript_37884/m.49770 type:complete len:84 (-) Transcript_37884:163-414(-)|eukprot:CAMPEP_0170456584 /NCGR_PEP_ID=MMETSP0123-20130129/4168_1 /TAXON_ID=182087 /ORGANISM="Favella ehrenbergii, Strain Fehren 1" /LENGTH=83 /DNA_ID=CAMNT_0010720107 /DNA_START=2113 /DNA_END=2364 /DNA_ORIENTATION=+